MPGARGREHLTPTSQNSAIAEYAHASKAVCIPSKDEQGRGLRVRSYRINYYLALLGFRHYVAVRHPPTVDFDPLVVHLLKRWVSPCEDRHAQDAGVRTARESHVNGI